jgi:hypothetical protein
MTAEGAEDFVQIGGDDHLVFEEILEPEIIVSVSEGDQRQQIAQTNTNSRFLSGKLQVILWDRIDTKMRGHR